jgi:CHASE3 domain sensor protein|tara:strand:- start:46 stop:381 length:336 start_codon:yes stop_codon:yes gene_type:complete
MESYSKQRNDRMRECVDDYLMDDDLDARACYENMLMAVQEVIDYHRKELDKASELYDLMQGHRPIDSFDDAYGHLAAQQNVTVRDDGSKAYNYAANITLADIAKFQRGSSL